MVFAALSGCEENVIYVQESRGLLMIDRAWPRQGSAGDYIAVYGENFGDTSQLDAAVGGVPAQIYRLDNREAFSRKARSAPRSMHGADDHTVRFPLSHSTPIKRSGLVITLSTEEV